MRAPRVAPRRRSGKRVRAEEAQRVYEFLWRAENRTKKGRVVIKRGAEFGGMRPETVARPWRRKNAEIGCHRRLRIPGALDNLLRAVVIETVNLVHIRWIVAGKV
ncbi:hypothetical protein PHYPSEUDO_007242 [Phytophthora pseudosyringae]|uniref:Uncharacterized protein n=1 Tax=Phytophthora pseudosyringae TaxID=221518 RepID=A0A8T1VH62_9STRA|nr:hypothetical protein PHYPSEUDO_007242 [Phytophthora pseudosyringae]